MEKSIIATTRTAFNVYGGVEEMTRKLGELRWLLMEEGRSEEIDVERIDERMQFR